MTDGMEKKSLTTVLYKYGLSRSLIWVVLACTIWGLFPWFVTGGVRTLSEKLPTAFILLRYLLATIGFFVLLTILNWSRNKSLGTSNFLSFFRKHLGRLVFMAITISLARWFEIKGYMNRDGWGDYKDFSIIYSILLITIWDCKAWFPAILNKLRLHKLSDTLRNSPLTEPFFSPLPTATEFFVWFAKCILIACSGLFLLYVLLGELPAPGDFFFKVLPFSNNPSAQANLSDSVVSWFSRLKFGPLVWALSAAFCTALFFDQMLWIKGKDDSQGIDTLIFATHVQLGTAIIICLLLTLLYGFQFVSNGTEIYADISNSHKILTGWNFGDFFKFTFGLVIAGTVMAFALEFYGAAAHDQKKVADGIGVRSIKGREWLSVMACVDPLIANITIIFLREKTETAVSVLWMGFPFACIFAVGLLSLVLLWSKKSDEIRREVFSGELLDNQHLDIKAKNLTRLLLYGTDSRDVNILRTQDSSHYYTIQEKAFATSDSASEKLLAEFVKDCRRLLMQLSNAPQGMRPQCSMFFLYNGQEWFSSYNLEGKTTFDNHLSAILNGTGNRIFRVEEIFSLFSRFQWAGVDLPYYKYDILNAATQVLNNQRLSIPENGGHTMVTIREQDNDLLLPLLIYNDANPELKANGGKALIVADDETLRSYWGKPIGKEPDNSPASIRENLDIDFEDFFTEARNLGWDFSEINYQILPDQHSQFPAKDPAPDANWLFLHTSFLRNIFDINETKAMPAWTHQKKVVFFYHDWMLPQSRRALGMSDITPLPELNLVTLANKQPGHEEQIKKILKMAEYRYQRAPQLLIVDDTPWKRVQFAKDASVAMIGTNGKIFTPGTLDQAKMLLADLTKQGQHKPLVFLDFDFSEWNTSENGLSFIKDHYTETDPWLFTTKGKLGGSRNTLEKNFPLARCCSNDRKTISRIIAWHTGVREKHTPWSSKFIHQDEVLGRWEELLIGLNNEKTDGSRNAYCHGLFLSYAEKRATRKHSIK